MGKITDNLNIDGTVTANEATNNNELPTLGQVTNLIGNVHNLLFTAKAKQELKNRFENGYVTGTGFNNDIAQVITQKDNFILNPSEFRPMYGENGTVTNSRQWMHTTAVYAYAMDDVSLANIVASEILATVNANNLDTPFWTTSDTLRWDAEHSLMIQTADIHKMKKSLKLLSNIQTVLTASNIDAVNDFFVTFSNLAYAGISSRINFYLGDTWVDTGVTKFEPEGLYPTLNGVATPNPVQDANGDDITEITIAWAQDIYNNRQWDIISYIHDVAIDYGNLEQEIWSRKFVKSFIKYAVFPDGTMAELWRNRDTDPTLGVFYSYITLSGIINMAHVDALYGHFPNDRLYDYSTADGIINGSTNLTASPFVGGSTTDGVTQKSLLTVLKAQSNYLRSSVDGGWNDLRFFKASDNTLTALSTVNTRQPSVIPAIANLYYKNQDLEDWYLYNTSVGYPAKVTISEGYLAGVGNEDMGAWGNSFAGSFWFEQENNFEFLNYSEGLNTIKTIENDLEVKGVVKVNDALADFDAVNLKRLNLEVYGESGKNLFRPDLVLESAFIDSNGNITTGSATYDVITIYIPESGDYIASHSARFSTFFDENDNVVTGGSNSNTLAFNIPATVAYVRLSIRKDEIANFQFERGTTSTSYEEFKYLKPQQGIGATSDIPVNAQLGDTYFDVQLDATLTYTKNGWVTNIPSNALEIKELSEGYQIIPEDGGNVLLKYSGTNDITIIINTDATSGINQDIMVSALQLGDGKIQVGYENDTALGLLARTSGINKTMSFIRDGEDNWIFTGNFEDYVKTVIPSLINTSTREIQGANPSVTFDNLTPSIGNQLFMFISNQAATQITVPAGWTSVSNVTGAFTEYDVYTKVSDGTEGTNNTTNALTISSDANTSQLLLASFAEFSPIDSIESIQTTGEIAGGEALTNVPINAITSTEDNSLGVLFIMNNRGRDTEGSVPPSNYNSEEYSYSTSTGGDGWHLMYSQDLPTASTIAADNIEFTNGENVVTVNLVLKPQII